MAITIFKNNNAVATLLNVCWFIFYWSGSTGVHATSCVETKTIELLAQTISSRPRAPVPISPDLPPPSVSLQSLVGQTVQWDEASIHYKYRFIHRGPNGAERIEIELSRIPSASENYPPWGELGLLRRLTYPETIAHGNGPRNVAIHRRLGIEIHGTTAQLPAASFLNHVISRLRQGLGMTNEPVWLFEPLREGAGEVPAIEVVRLLAQRRFVHAEGEARTFVHDVLAHAEQRVFLSVFPEVSERYRSAAHLLLQLYDHPRLQRPLVQQAILSFINGLAFSHDNAIISLSTFMNTNEFCDELSYNIDQLTSRIPSVSQIRSLLLGQSDERLFDVVPLNYRLDAHARSQIRLTREEREAFESLVRNFHIAPLTRNERRQVLDRARLAAQWLAAE